jgi:hypothetical protein
MYKNDNLEEYAMKKYDRTRNNGYNMKNATTM